MDQDVCGLIERALSSYPLPTISHGQSSIYRKPMVFSVISVRFLPSRDGQCVHRFVSSKGAMDVIPNVLADTVSFNSNYIENSHWVSHIPHSWSSLVKFILLLFATLARHGLFYNIILYI